MRITSIQFIRYMIKYFVLVIVKIVAAHTMMLIIDMMTMNEMIFVSWVKIQRGAGEIVVPVR